MDCSLIHGNLIAYHLGAMSDAERVSVETHLVVCTSCLRAYLALKAHVDRVGEEQTGPSDAARLRLRGAVERRFRPTPVRVVRRWLARPVPFYQGLAVAAVLVLVATLGPALARPPAREATADTAHRIDTSRTASESLTIY